MAAPVYDFESKPVIHPVQLLDCIFYGLNLVLNVGRRCHKNPQEARSVLAIVLWLLYSFLGRATRQSTEDTLEPFNCFPP